MDPFDNVFYMSDYRKVAIPAERSSDEIYREFLTSLTESELRCFLFGMSLTTHGPDTEFVDFFDDGATEFTMDFVTLPYEYSSS